MPFVHKAVFFVAFLSLAILHHELASSFMVGSTNHAFSAGMLGRPNNKNSIAGKLSMKAKGSSSYFPPQKESGRRKKRRLREAKSRARFLNGENTCAHKK